jgi:hypothetical protein
LLENDHSSSEHFHEDLSSNVLVYLLKSSPLLSGVLLEVRRPIGVVPN